MVKKKRTITWIISLLSVVLFLGCTVNKVSKYRPPVKDTECIPSDVTRGGIALAISGGGYRATLFHLGALRRLNELGLLHRISEISSVSGGSIISAHLATYISKHGGKLDKPISPEDWENEIAKPLRAFTTKDIRTGPILKRYLIPWNWFRSTVPINALAEEFEEKLTDLKLVELPDHPDFVFNATDISFAAKWEMRKYMVGNFRAGYLVPPPETWTVGRAVAASAAFPPVFQPMLVEDDPGEFKGYHFYPTESGVTRSHLPDKCWKTENWETVMSDLRLSDGGVYDNLGLRTIWGNRKYILVSDAGTAIHPEPDQGFFWRVSRWTGIMSQQNENLIHRLIIALNENWGGKVIFWSIRFGHNGYSEDLARNFLANIRTDFNEFSSTEGKILENHGYLIMDKKLMDFAAREKRAHPDGESFSPSIGSFNMENRPELRVPFPKWLPPMISECDIKKALVEKFDGCNPSER